MFRLTHQASRTFFVSGQAQHALHFGFSVVVVAGDGGVDVTSGAFESELPILLVSVHSNPNKKRDNELTLLLNCIRKIKITSALIVQGHLRFGTEIKIDAWKFNVKMKSMIFTMIFCPLGLVNVFSSTGFTHNIKTLCTTALL